MSKTLYRIVSCTTLASMLAGCTPTDHPREPQNSAPQTTAPALSAKPALLPQTQPPTARPQQQRVQALVDQVEKAYANGQAAYRKGQLAAAKAEFDRAVDLMLTSGIDIKNDPQLSDEFDRIVDGINGLEMEALKIGNGFAPKVEPAPADVANDVTFSVDPNLVAKAQSELATTKSDLPLVVNDYVAAFINFFANTQKGHNTLLHSFQRSGRYKSMIQRVMAEEGVPQDLIYLAVAESGFQPRAINPGSRAGGMWQFMPAGNYGLTRNGYVDERFDPEKSTRAYARYMKFLYDQLGDWYLAMAAYDWGAGNVQRAVQKTGYADFWELYKRNNLPGETKNYVPEILAAIIIANHPTQYGFDEITLDPPVLTDTVTISYSVDLRLVADIVDTPVDELVALNPSLLRMVTPADGPFDLHLPAGTALVYQRRIQQVPEAHRDAWRYHPVRPEDTLASVAHSYHVDVSELAAANQLHEDDKLDGVEALVVPAAPAVQRFSRGSNSNNSSSMFYTTRRGDTLVSVADRFGVSLAQLRSWNNLRGLKIAAGRRLRVTEPAHIARTRGSSRHAAAADNTSDDRSSVSESRSKSGRHRSSHRKHSSKTKADTAKSSEKSDRKETTRSSEKSESKEMPSVKEKSSAKADTASTPHKKSRKRAHSSKK